jgi:flagellar biogenesis protein FliO
MAINATSILSAIAALAAVLALICLIGRLARFGGFTQRPKSGRSLAVQDVLVLDTRRRVYLVTIEQRRVLLLIGDGRESVIGWLDAKEPPE